jgi:hypothetical protein
MLARDFLAGILAPQLAFLRADGKTVDGAGRFLQKVAAAGALSAYVRAG